MLRTQITLFIVGVALCAASPLLSYAAALALVPGALLIIVSWFLAVGMVLDEGTAFFRPPARTIGFLVSTLAVAPAWTAGVMLLLAWPTRPRLEIALCAIVFALLALALPYLVVEKRCRPQARTRRLIALAAGLVWAVPISLWSAEPAALHSAAAHGRWLQVEWLLRLHWPIDARDDSGRTPLFEAAASASPRTVRLFLDRGADPNAIDNARVTPLESAIYAGDRASLELLLERGARVQSGNSLSAATAVGRLDLVELLLARGANPAQGNWFGQTPLMTAARAPNLAIAQRLLARGAPPNAETDEAATALTEAIVGPDRAGALAMTRLLVASGADVNRGNPLARACDVGDPAIVAYLLAWGADPSRPDSVGRTASEICRERNLPAAPPTR